MEKILVYSTFYVLLALGLGWLVGLFRVMRSRKGSSSSLFSEVVFPITWSLVLATLLFAIYPPKVKLVWDEPGHVVISKRFFENQQFKVSDNQLYKDGHFENLSEDIPDRPAFYSFLLTLIHFFHGYHWQDLFVLSFCGIFFLLLISSCIGQKIMGRVGALAAPLLVMSSPSVLYWGSSGSYDVMATAMWMLGFFLLWRIKLNAGEDRQALIAFFILHSSLFTQMRAEGFLLALLAPWLIYQERMQILHPKLFWTGCAWAISLLLRFLHIMLSPMEMARIANNSERYQWLRAIENAWIFLRAFFIDGRALPYSPAINILGLVGLLWMARRVPLKYLLGGALTSLTALVAILPSKYGDLHWVTLSRYSLVLSSVLGLSILWLAPQESIRRRNAFVLSIALIGVVFSVKKIIFDFKPVMRSSPIFFQIVLENLGDRSREGKPTQIIAQDGIAMIHLALGYHPMTIEWASSHQDQLLEALKQKGSPSYFMVSTISQKQMEPIWENRISEIEFRLVDRRPFADGDDIGLWQLAVRNSDQF